jgi:hypothetical protein
VRGAEIDEEEARVRKNSRGSHHWGSFFQTSKVARDFAKVEFYIYFLITT